MNNQSIIAKGNAAIELAESDKTVQLNKYSDPIEGAQDDIDSTTAREVAKEDPSLIYATRRAE